MDKRRKHFESSHQKPVPAMILCRGCGHTFMLGEFSCPHCFGTARERVSERFGAVEKTCESIKQTYTTYGLQGK